MEGSSQEFQVSSETILSLALPISGRLGEQQKDVPEDPKSLSQTCLFLTLLTSGLTEGVPEDSKSLSEAVWSIALSTKRRL